MFYSYYGEVVLYIRPEGDCFVKNKLYKTVNFGNFAKWK